MVVRRSNRIVGLEKQERKPIVKFFPPRLTRAQELREKENEELKEKLEKMKKKLTTTENRLIDEQKNVAIWERKVTDADNDIDVAHVVFRELKNEMEASAGVLRKQLQQLIEAEGRAQVCKDHKNEKEAVEKEERNTERYRDILLVNIKKYKNDTEGGLLPWKICEHCVMPFGAEIGRTPRVLNCGHTFCTDCVGTFESAKQMVRCPLDCQYMTMGEGGVSEFPKNFVLLNT